MRSLLLGAVAIISMSVAGAAVAATPFDGSEIVTSQGGHVDMLIGTPATAFLLDVEIDMSLLGAPGITALGKYTNRYWEDPYGYVYDENLLDYTVGFDPTAHSAVWFNSASPTRTFDFRPTADGFQLAYFGGDNYCWDGRTGHNCSQQDKVWAVAIYGLLPTDETIPVSWTFSDAPPLSSVPEPVTWALMIGGFAMVGLGLRRQRVQLSA